MKNLPVGVENFKELIDKDYYHVDKTEFILTVLEDKVALYTRPRRFGKTLNMSMIRYFFDLKQKESAYLFDGLKIQNHPEALKHQNQYPVISISLKDMKKRNLHLQIDKLKKLIKTSIQSYAEVKNSKLLTEKERKQFELFLDADGDDDLYEDALLIISELLYKHYGKKVIILIDEYDVPLQNAYSRGYYEEMIDFMRNLFSSALKTNDALEKGIMTGCLRIANESIFTGLNNFRVHSIFDNAGSEYFGFTEDETKHLLSDYGMLEQYDSIKEWYDGYLFGNTEIYNPWSLILSVEDYLKNQTYLVSYWSNTSGNNIIYDYIKQGDEEMRQDFEDLVQGRSIIKSITPELTYRDMDEINNIYSFLLFTGYLKIKSQIDRTTYELIIPNKEVACIFEDSYMRYFNDIKKDKSKELLQYLKEGKTEEANRLLNEILMASISFYDNYESFYHGFMMGLFSNESPISNREAGVGRFDVGVLTKNPFGTSILFEFKYSKNSKDLKLDSEIALRQIIDKKYIEGLEYEGFYNIKAYGVAFYGKYCYISKSE